MKIDQVKFNFFLSTPIIYDEDDSGYPVDFIYYRSPQIYVYNETVDIQRSLFMNCLSQNSGGGMHFVNKNGLITVTDTYFQNCVSYMQGGGAFFKCSEITMHSIIFNLCNSASSQAAYLEASVYSEITLVLAYNCFIAGEVTHMGPVIDIENDYEELLYYPTYESFNFSYNCIRTDNLNSLCAVRCYGNAFDFWASMYLSLFTFFENVCPSEIECQGKDGMVTYFSNFNMIQNHLSNSVFIVSGENYCFAYECFIGHDYDVFYFPPQTPQPTESPLPTIIPPTPPNFTLQYIPGILLKEEMNQKEHYEYAFNRAKNKFEKVYYIPENDINKNSGFKQFNDKKIFNRYVSNVKKKNLFVKREKPEIVLALFPDNTGSIYFDMCKIDYPETDFVDCYDQCYISSFDTYQIEEHTLFDFDISIDSETNEYIIKSEEMKKFSLNTANIAIMCMILAFVLILYVIVFSVACAKLRINDDHLLNEGNDVFVIE